MAMRSKGMEKWTIKFIDGGYKSWIWVSDGVNEVVGNTYRDAAASKYDPV